MDSHLCPVGAIFLYPIPYIMKLGGYWSNENRLFRWRAEPNGQLTYLFPIRNAEVVGFIIGGVMLDSMMADIVEDSEVKTSRRSEGDILCSKKFCGKIRQCLCSSARWVYCLFGWLGWHKNRYRHD